jgi:hypothetical protein
MERSLAEKRGLQPLGVFRGFAVAGCEPDEMGIGPVFAIPKLLKRHGLKVPIEFPEVLNVSHLSLVAVVDGLAKCASCDPQTRRWFKAVHVGYQR